MGYYDSNGQYQYSNGPSSSFGAQPAVPAGPQVPASGVKRFGVKNHGVNPAPFGASMMTNPNGGRAMTSKDVMGGAASGGFDPYLGASTATNPVQPSMPGPVASGARPGEMPQMNAVERARGLGGTQVPGGGYGGGVSWGGVANGQNTGGSQAALSVYPSQQQPSMEQDRQTMEMTRRTNAPDGNSLPTAPIYGIQR